MAKREDRENQPTRRVFKSSDVHQRRVGDSARQKPAKMPTRREARESARESTRINAEARAGKVRAPEPDAEATTEAVEENVDQAAQAEQAAQTEQAASEADREPARTPRFTAMRGSKGGDQSEQPSRRRPRFVESEAATSERPQGAEPQPEEPAAPSGDSAQQPKDAGKPRLRTIAGAASKLPSLKPSTIAIGAVLVIAVVAVAFFAFNRWGRFDDHADMQGTWYVLGTEVPIQIDDTSIRFNEEVSYQYEIDARGKTISYTFGPMSGQGRYWFSDDRKHLVITDGDGYTAANTTVEDLMHAFLDFSTATGGGVVELPQGEGIIAFSRTPEPVVKNEAAEGLVVKPSGESASAQASQPAAEAATGEQGGAADAAATAEEEPIAEDGALDEAHVEDAASEETYDESRNKEEAA